MLEINRGLFAHALFQYGLKAGNVFLKEEKKEEKHGARNESNTKMQIQRSHTFARELGSVEIYCKVFWKSLLLEMLRVFEIEIP